MSYNPGVIWLTRTRIAGYTTPPNKRTNKDKVVVIPKKENVMLLAYILDTSFSERVQLLWKDKVIYVEDVDVGLQFRFINR